MMSRTILIVMSKTGGGHRASAEALKEVFIKEHGDAYQVEIIDLLQDYLPGLMSELPKTYNFMAGKAPWSWGLLWKTTKFRPLAEPIYDLFAIRASPSVQRVIRQFAPALIISVHPLAQGLLARALRDMRSDLPFVIVTTDLATLHPLWFHRVARLCFVASAEAYQTGLKVGMRPAQLRQYGLPVRPIFATEPRPKATLRRELGMDLDLPAALLVGGGEGMGRVRTVAHATALSLKGPNKPHGQLIVVCGRNRHLKTRLTNARWPIPTQILGFVDNMSDWMAACDCIVTKAGPGTIAEAMIRGLPIILSSMIPGQEEGNIPYVVDNDAGYYQQDPHEIAAIIVRWFRSDQAEMQRMAENSRRLGNPRSTYEIVEDIVSLL